MIVVDASIIVAAVRSVALAERLEAPLVTADARLARAPGPRCAITVLTG